MVADEGGTRRIEEFLAFVAGRVIEGLGEMLPSARFERLRALWGNQCHRRPACAGSQNAADASHWDAGDGAGQAGGGWSGEEQFVVLASVEGLSQICSQTKRQERRIDLGGHAGFLAEMSQISGEAIAQVEGGGCQAMALQPKSLGNARLGIEVRGEQHFQLFGDARRRGARW